MLGIFVHAGRHYSRRVPNWGRAHSRIELLCSEPMSSKQLRIAVLEVLRQAIGYDAHVWLLTDPVTQVGTSPLADIPGLAWAELPALIRRRYLAGGAWTDFRPVGAADVATSVYADKFGYWGWLDLWRTNRTFTANERDFLDSLIPTLTVALRTGQARTFTDTAADVEAPAAAVIILGPDLQPKGRTSAAADALFQLNPPDAGVRVVPAAAYNVAAALLAAEAGQFVGPAWSRVHIGGARWVTLSAARMDGGDIAVTIEPSTPAQRRAIFALAHGLSPRERQVLDELVTGADSPAIARRLVISEHTVNDHVKAILAKTGLSTRPRLLARIAG
jgi:DNA-binding CsgD family transcriptional regulator